MIRSLLNWRSLLALVAIIIVSATVFYSQYLAKKIAADERQKVELWVAASNQYGWHSYLSGRRPRNGCPEPAKLVRWRKTTSGRNK